LIFIAHQDGGYVWVFDVNPAVTNDFAYVGKYKTNETESCDAAFDRSTGLLYILHNTGDNYLEVTDMTTTLVSGEYKFATKKNFIFQIHPVQSTWKVLRFRPNIQPLRIWACGCVAM